MPETAAVMRVLEWSVLDEAGRRQLLERGLDAIFDPELRRTISAIIDDVRIHGDEAVCRALRDHDGIDVVPESLRVGEDELARASGMIDDGLGRALDDAIDHLRRFNRELLARAASWTFETEPGLVVGEKVTPITSAGLFCPSGKASYPSVMAQLGTPAVEAGVPRIAVVVPPVPGGLGAVDPAVLTVCERLGLRDVFRANGPAGIAALGFGTDTIPRVRKVVGPGSPAVTCAQVEMQRHGVSTMMLLGPSESMIIADASADPARLAADLLNESEHGTDSATVFVTAAPELVEAVERELSRQIIALPAARAEAAAASLGVNGGCVIVDGLDTAIDVANRYAPEHLQVAVAPEHEAGVVDRLVNAGEILIGQHTPFSAANFVIGCPASLPTSGFAHVSSGITVEAFLKRTALARADEHALRRMAPTVLAFADHEGFPAHGNAVRMRLARPATPST
jgi:histidinol dehydrogenase